MSIAIMSKPIRKLFKKLPVNSDIKGNSNYIS